MFVGVFILLLGVLMLLEELGIIYGDWSDYILPIALIALGASMAFSNKIKKKR